MVIYFINNGNGGWTYEEDNFVDSNIVFNDTNGGGMCESGTQDGRNWGPKI